jgi:hypothetical protein
MLHSTFVHRVRTRYGFCEHRIVRQQIALAWFIYTNQRLTPRGALARRLKSLTAETPGEAFDSAGGAAISVAAQLGFEQEVGEII